MIVAEYARECLAAVEMRLRLANVLKSLPIGRHDAARRRIGVRLSRAEPSRERLFR
jgi:hypothetical protein